jgi:hypothetical protein
MMAMFHMLVKMGDHAPRTEDWEMRFFGEGHSLERIAVKVPH